MATQEPRKKIQGYSQSRRAPRRSGLDEFYALQNRGVSSFPSEPGGSPSAGELADMAAGTGLQIDRGGVLRPRGTRQFQQLIEQRQQMQRNPGVSVTPGMAPGPGGVPMVIPTVGRSNTLEPAQPAAPATPSPADNRRALQTRASGLNLLRETEQAKSGVVSPNPGAQGGSILTSRYGTGSSVTPPEGERRKGLINGRPAAEVLQGIANAQGRTGLSRPGDKYQPKPDMSAGDNARLQTKAEGLYADRMKKRIPTRL